MKTRECRHCALRYARRGWPVVPVHSTQNDRCTCGKDDCQSPGKHPRTGHGIKDATTDENKIEHWWAKWPHANIGIATGYLSGLLVLDVDPRHGGDESLKGILSGVRVPETPTVRTGGGGRHFYFKCPTDLRVRSRNSILPGLDVKADGGYAIAPPSQTMRKYLWLHGLTHQKVKLASLPPWLTNFLTKPKRKNGLNDAANGGPVTEGRRHDFLLRAAGGLRRQGATTQDIEAALLAVNQIRCSPPLPDEEVQRIAESAEHWKPVANGSEYIESAEGLFWMKTTGMGTHPVKLANFRARIVGEIKEDDGVETRRNYEMEVNLQGDTQRFAIPEGNFASMSWVGEHLGAKAIVAPGFGLRDHTRAAIQELSVTEIGQRTVFAHSGWRKHEGEWLYLHRGGAIGRAGATPDIKVQLPDCLASFKLPRPPKGATLRNAIRKSLHFLDIGPHRATFSTYAGVWRSVQGPCDHSLFIAGPTGAGKTVIAALLQQHFGRGFDARHLPGSWMSTPNANEGLAFCAKDMLLTIDDFAPTGNRTDLARYHAAADRLLRAQGNLSGRSRMKPDSTLRATKAPRGLILSTGEDIPRGQSLRARIFALELSQDSLDWQRVTECQRFADSGMYSQVLSAFLCWLAAHYADVSERRIDKFVELREQAAGSEQHRKTPEIVANLQLGMDSFLRFARAVAAVSEKEAAKLKDQCWNALGDAARAQHRHQKSEDPVVRFLQLMQSLLASGRVFLEDLETDNCRNQKGDRVGWLQENVALLNPDAAFAAVQKLAQDQGEFLTIGQKTLWARMRDRGLLLGSDADRNLKRETIHGDRQRVVRLPKGLLSLDAGDRDNRDVRDRDGRATQSNDR
jgi:hypothetical protein